MTSQELNRAIQAISNAYIQFLLYKNGIIKSSSLSLASYDKDITRKLCFFLKTSWIHKLTDAGLIDFVSEVKIRNGMVTVSMPYTRWMNGQDTFNQIQNGFYNHIMDLNGFDISGNARHADRLVTTYCNRSGNDFTATISPTYLQQEALNEAQNNDTATTSFLKAFYDEAYENLIKIRDMIVPIVEHRKYIVDYIREAGIPSGVALNYEPTMFDIYCAFGYDNQEPYNNDNKVAKENLKQAIMITYNFAKGADLIEALKEKKYSSRDDFIEVFKFGSWNRDRMTPSIEAAGRIQAWVEGVSRELRGINQQVGA